MLSYPRIVFFGTPEFAVASLEELLAAGYPVVGVVTAPDRPAGRGLKARPSPVKLAALHHNLPVLQPEKLRHTDFLQQLADLKPDLQVVIAFRMLPAEVWQMPPLGTINLHASLLPDYRGAAPINHAIIQGETETGVTTFFINEQIDTGSILLSERTEIGRNETAGELHDRLMKIGAGLVARTVTGIAAQSISPVSQDRLLRQGAELKMAPKIFREFCRIDWQRDVRQIHDFVRGLSPSPGAYTELNLPGGERAMLRVFRTLPEQDPGPGKPGTFFAEGSRLLKVRAADGYIHILELQLAGRKAMNAGEFLRGYGRFFSETCDS